MKTSKSTVRADSGQTSSADATQICPQKETNKVSKIYIGNADQRSCEPKRCSRWTHISQSIIVVSIFHEDRQEMCTVAKRTGEHKKLHKTVLEDFGHAPTTWTPIMGTNTLGIEDPILFFMYTQNPILLFQKNLENYAICDILYG